MQRTNFVIFSLVFASVVLVCVEGKSLSKINYVTELDDFESTDSLEHKIVRDTRSIQTNSSKNNLPYVENSSNNFVDKRSLHPARPKPILNQYFYMAHGPWVRIG
uniref:Putative secreted protein n=1 Tax=Xenopsylla cheopis TaxID=163159 RepID=A0A6M2DZW8_XENCH